MITSIVFPPALLLIAAGLLIPFLSGAARTAVLLIAPVITLWLIWQVPDGVHLTANWLGYQLEIVRGDKLARLFATVFSIMAFAGGLFSLNQSSSFELGSAYTYAGGAIGVTFAGDLITVFIFWEIMAVASTLVVWSGGRGAQGSGLRYAAVHMFGGVLLMAGITGEILNTGSIAFQVMDLSTVARWLILAGFLINAGAPPFSAWLPDAYPAASWSGMVFLSAFTTKTAVYVLLRGFPGTELLIYVGLYMVFYGIVYAILENDMRRILAYSIINQVGFMVTGIGIGTQMALNGAASHAFTHIIYKALLLMSAGSVLLMTGKNKCTDLGGLFRTMPYTMVMGVIGALAISSFPLTSGFISKSMISQGAANEHLAFVWFMLAAASAGVFLHAGIKFPWFVFFQKDSGLRPPEPPWNMRAGMALMAAFCIGLGIWPGPLYDLLPYPVDYVPYTPSHVVYQLQLLLFSGLAFFIMLEWLKRTETITLDFDWFYRKPGGWISRGMNDELERGWNKLMDRADNAITNINSGIYRFHGPDGVFGRTWPTGRMAFWATAMLGAYVLLSYFE